MITKKDILKMVRHVTKRAQGVPDKRLIHPRREWGIGVTLAVLFLFIGVFYTGIVYKQYDRIGEETVGEVDQVVRYNASLVDQAITYYRTQQATFDALLRNAPAPVLPPVVEDEDATIENAEESVADAADTEVSELVDTATSVVEDPAEPVSSETSEAETDEPEEDEVPILLES